MTYNIPLPAIRELLDLAAQTKFPKTAKELVEQATSSGESTELVSFLNNFSPGTKFVSRVDFLTRSEELELLMSQERAMPAEILRSPQG